MTTKPIITPHRYVRVAILGLWLLMAVVVVGATAPTTFAHAEVDRSLPAADSIIPTGPQQVEVWFTQELFRREGANRLEVVAPDGNRVDLDDSRIDDDDRTHLLVSLQSDLPAGTYTVRWFNTSLEDGHAEEGEFGFTIDPNAPTPMPTEVSSDATAAIPTMLPEPTSPPALTAAPVIATPTPAPATGMPACFNGLILFPFLLGMVGFVGWSRKGRRR